MNLAQSQPHLDDPITRYMRKDYAVLYADQTVEEALASIRQYPPTGRIIYFYVVDKDNRLQGVVPTRRLLLGSLEQKIRDIMVREVISLPYLATVMDACELFMIHRLLAIPVLDPEKGLLGIVDVDLYTTERSDLDQVERNEDLFQLIGVHLQGRKASAWGAFRIRFPWLMCNIAGGILAAFLSGAFEAELARAVALALFIPVVLGLSESVSIQSVSLALQGLHGSRPTIKSIFQKLSSEVVTGLLLGLACAVLVGIVEYLWKGDIAVFFCLLGGIGGGVTLAAVIGMAMPNFLKLFSREPQVAAGPIALACTDMVTLLIYLGLARQLL